MNLMKYRSENKVLEFEKQIFGYPQFIQKGGMKKNIG